MTTTTTPALPACPYRGIEPFRYVDYPVFFAREEETHKLVRLITVYRCVLLYGDSGAGKSSLINAGFIPGAAEFAPERLRVQPVRDAEIIIERISQNEEGRAPYLHSYFASPGDDAARIVLSARAFRDRLMLFRAEDVDDPEGLATRLKTSEDAANTFLREHLQPSTRQMLNEYEEHNPVSDEFLAALLSDLNQQVLSRSDLYDEKRFAQVGLTPETRQILSQPQTGEGPLLRNRLLLQELYAGEIQLKPRPLLILDQFEELITLFEEAPPDREKMELASRAQHALLDVLAALLQDPALPVKLLFVFREDYLAKIRKRFAPRYSLPEQFFYLTPPRVQALHKIIRGPFEEYPGAFAKELSEPLAEQFAAQMRERSEAGHVNLSEVQIACLRLWQAEDPEALFRQKGVQGLLEDYLSEALRGLSPDLYDSSLALLSRMVTRSGARNPISEDDLLDPQQYDNIFTLERLRAALLALRDQARLVVRESRRDMAVYQIASEYLSPWIRDYRIESEKRLAEQQARRARRRTQQAIAAAVAIFLVALFLGWAASRFRQESLNKNTSITNLEQLKKKQETELARLDDLTKNAQQRINDAQTKLNEAETKLNRAQDELKEAETTKQKAEQELQKAERDAQTARSEVQKIQERTRTASADLEEKQKLVATLSGEVGTLKEQRQELETQKQELEKQKLALATQLQDLERQRQELAKRYQEVAKQYQAVEQVAQVQERKIIQQENAINALQTTTESTSLSGGWKGIVGRSFTPDEFDAYVRGLQFTLWRPSFAVLHHLGTPSLAQRPNGLTKANLENLEKYYRDTQRWKSGPHLLIDDRQIWVFTPLTVSGTHSPSWNKASWGVEMLGDYDKESFTEERAQRVRDNTVAAIATLYTVAGLDPSTLRIHREDPLTSNTCPGKNVDKEDFVRRVQELMARRRSGGR